MSDVCSLDSHKDSVFMCILQGNGEKVGRYTSFIFCLVSFREKSKKKGKKKSGIPKCFTFTDRYEWSSLLIRIYILNQLKK